VVCVNELKIAPSEAWKLDVIEVTKLLNQQSKADDLSVMLNFERIQNGASKQWLLNH